jgi:hypothetical protein
MTMYHHDSRDFDAAKSEAASEMRNKLLREIDRSRNDGEKAIAKILGELPRDRMRRMTQTEFRSDGDGVLNINYLGEEPETIHPFALSKMCETVGIPAEFVRRLIKRHNDKENWGSDLVVDMLNKHFHNQAALHDRRMIRSVNDETRGFMSDSYARLHPGKLIETFAEQSQKFGMLPYGGFAGDTKFMVRAVLDRVIEPVKDEVIGIGVVLKESPYGDGATELSIQIERMWCTNKAIATSALRKVHLGAKVSFDADEADENYRLATETMCNEMRRAFRTQLDPGYIAQLEDGIRKAHDAKVTHTQFESFLKKHLNKEDVEVVKEKYRSTDITNLPAGDSWWRASNALSWYANQKSSAEEAYDLQKLAGQALEYGAKAKN